MKNNMGGCDIDLRELTRQGQHIEKQGVHNGQNHHEADVAEESHSNVDSADGDDKTPSKLHRFTSADHGQGNSACSTQCTVHSLSGRM